MVKSSKVNLNRKQRYYPLIHQLLLLLLSYVMMTIRCSVLETHPLCKLFIIFPFKHKEQCSKHVLLRNKKKKHSMASKTWNFKRGISIINLLHFHQQRDKFLRHFRVPAQFHIGNYLFSNDIKQYIVMFVILITLCTVLVQNL